VYYAPSRIRHSLGGVSRGLALLSAPMDLHLLADGLLNWLMFIPLLTFHEWAHAWVALKCGDDTAEKLGRISVNPLVHMEVIGTVVLPLLAVVMRVAGSSIGIIGWGKPVPVDWSNLSNVRLQDSLIALAGPAMNLLIAVALVGAAKLVLMAGLNDAVELILRMAELSLFLCFFNLFPIPPLDGFHVLCHSIRLPYETYLRVCSMGFIFIFIFVQFDAPMIFLARIVQNVFVFLLRVVGLDF
jgi:Zn-dependent protease